MKNVIIFALMLSTISAYADDRFKYKNMYYVETSDSTVTLVQGIYNGDVIIPDSVVHSGKKLAVTEIGAGAFNNNYSTGYLNSIEIPSTIRRIKSHAFECQYNIKKIVFKGGNITFEVSAFPTSSSTRRSIYINQIEDWCSNSFYISQYQDPMGSNPLQAGFLYIQNQDVKDLLIPSSVHQIPACAFYQAYLETLTIEDGLTSIGTLAFRSCNSLKKVILPTTLIGIGREAFKGCNLSNEITIPENVTSMGDYVFDENPNIKKIVWKAKSIYNANDTPSKASFYLTSGKLDTLVIDSGVVRLPKYMFYSTICHATCVIVTKNTNVPLADPTTFDALNTDCIVKVPFGTADNYRTSTGWSKFYYFIEENAPDYSDIIQCAFDSYETPQKHIMDGKLYILQGNHTYSIQGQLIK